MMKAVAFYKTNPHDQALVDIELPKPVAEGRDLLVKINAVAINPVDVKMRNRVADGTQEPKIFGYDAAGVVEAIGPQVTAFKPGDAVFYAGTVTRPGTYAEYHLVDERIVGPKPATLSFAEAAALPLTSLTAREMLFDRLAIPLGSAGASVLLIGGAGGVGSMAIQFARRLTDLTVIATASRPDSSAWCRKLGAHHVIDHMQPLAPQIASLGAPPVVYVFCISGTDMHWPAITDLIAPQGRVGIIEDPESMDVRLAKAKSVSIHWESMFTRAAYQTADMHAQGQILTRIAELVENGKLTTTLAEVLGPISASTVADAHRRIVGSHPSGKMVLEGVWPDQSHQ